MTRGVRASLVLGLPVALALGGASCEIITHASDFDVARHVRFEGACNRCRENAEANLHHVPCPNPNVAKDSSATFTYAARRFSFGHARDWEQPRLLPSFDLGFDIDCSARRSGEPARCSPIPLDGGPATPWTPLPRGIDNSLSQRVLAPLAAAASAAGESVDLDAVVSANYERGSAGFIVQVEQWNQTVDDPSVKVSIFASPGIAAEEGAPRWDGSDVWSTYGEDLNVTGRYFKLLKANGYVTNGVLVVDARAKGLVNFRFSAGGAIGSGPRSFLVSDLVISGKLTEQRIDHLVMSGITPLASIYDAAEDAARLFAGCNATAAAKLKPLLTQLLVGAADVPSDPDNPGGDCDALSFAIALDAVKAQIGAVGEEPADGGCK
jgi:hypothetical protein